VPRSTTKRMRALERELARNEKALAEAAALLVLKKNSRCSRRTMDDDTTRTPNRDPDGPSRDAPGRCPSGPCV
jgi:hypothetical protein